MFISYPFLWTIGMGFALGVLCAFMILWVALIRQGPGRQVERFLIIAEGAVALFFAMLVIAPDMITLVRLSWVAMFLCLCIPDIRRRWRERHPG
jgi:hypothetical protein